MNMSGDLGEYRRKRDFRRTSEPAGGRKTDGRRRSLRFVIQKHAASHLHFDLRLELDGVMKSWAVPKGPSLDPAIRRLAMQVEDHPVEYNSFEGTIPQGEYGGGTVMLWDRGTYAPDEPRPGDTGSDAVRRGLRAGKLSFSFDGERLHGSFALVRTGSGGRQWLLIKHRDSVAAPGSDITAEIITSVESGRTMEEIAGDGDRTWHSNRPAARRRTAARKAGGPGGDASPSAAGSGDVMTPMRPVPARKAPQHGAWSWEPWRGGVRVMAYAAPDGARLVDEEARDLSGAHGEIVQELASLAARAGRPFVLEGEIAAGDDGAPALHAADLILDGDDVLASRPWRFRRDALRSLLHRRRLSRIRRMVATGLDSAMRQAIRRGWPGVLGRRDDAPYTAGERSDAFIRLAP
jgi:bifunctional non-homologous end joining protein LigD